MPASFLLCKLGHFKFGSWTSVFLKYRNDDTYLLLRLGSTILVYFYDYYLLQFFNQLFVYIYFQVPRVMSSHNNNSFSSLPFTPSSTSSLSSSHHAQSQLQQSASHAGQAAIGPASTAQTSSNWQLNHLLAPSSGIGGGHRKLPVRTSNNVTVTRKGSSNKYTNSASPSATSEAVSLPIRHWWTAVFHHHGDQHNR